jgi:regulator of sirC expression with transglutaminase-like and TPR domain
MLNNSGEILALINLIEDPDDEVYNSITTRFVGYGKTILPILKEQLDFTSDPMIVKRIENIVFKVSISLLTDSLQNWKELTSGSLQEASILISNFIEPNTENEEVIFEIEKIKKSIWLEINDYLTPLEEIIIVNKILFTYYKIKGIETKFKSNTEFDFCDLLIKKTGNRFPLGALYLILCDMLNISVKPIDIPQQNLLAYYVHEEYITEKNETALFFIDPINGHVYTHQDIETYLKKINHPHDTTLLKPLSEKGYINKWIVGLAKCKKERGEKKHYTELLQLAEKFQEN